MDTASSSAADSIVAKVVLDDYGEVKMTCSGINGWKFSIERKMSATNEPGVFEVKFSAHGMKEELPPAVRVELVTEQKDVQFRWTPGNWSLPIPWLEYLGDMLARSISLAPVYAWISQTDRNRLAVSLSEAIRPTLYTGYECDMFGSKLHNAVTFFSRGGTSLRDYEAVIRYDFRDIPYWQAVSDGANWISTFPGQNGRDVPAVSYEPLWNSWYGYHIGYTSADILAEAKLAKELGIKTIMYDMGWDRHGSTDSSSFAECGDWRPDPRDFPDMKAHIAEIHSMGLKAMLWCGPSLMGKAAKNAERFKDKFTTETPSICGSCHALDPRFPDVRKFLTDTLVGGFSEWNIDGWKIDFIQEFHEHGNDRVPREGMNGRDFRYTGDATRVWLEEVVEKSRKIKPDAMFEYMMAYAGPVCQRAATQIRAGDCPADAQYNRNQTVRLRLLCGNRCSVLADMFTWSREEAPEDCALQIISTLHAVPIYGMRLTDLTEGQMNAVKHWVCFARTHAETLYHGTFRPHGPASNYPLIEMSSDTETVVTVHQTGMCAAADPLKPTYIVNGTGQTGLIIITKTDSCAEIYDTFGKIVETGSLHAGCHELNIPKGGYVRI